MLKFLANDRLRIKMQQHRHFKRIDQNVSQFFCDLCGFLWIISDLFQRKILPLKKLKQLGAFYHDRLRHVRRAQIVPPAFFKIRAHPVFQFLQ